MTFCTYYLLSGVWSCNVLSLSWLRVLMEQEDRVRDTTVILSAQPVKKKACCKWSVYSIYWLISGHWTCFKTLQWNHSWTLSLNESVSSFWPWNVLHEQVCYPVWMWNLLSSLNDEARGKSSSKVNEIRCCSISCKQCCQIGVVLCVKIETYSVL